MANKHGRRLSDFEGRNRPRPEHNGGHSKEIERVVYRLEICRTCKSEYIPLDVVDGGECDACVDRSLAQAFIDTGE